MSAYSDMALFDHEQQVLFTTLPQGEAKLLASLRDHAFGTARDQPIAMVAADRTKHIAVAVALEGVTAVFLHPSDQDEALTDFLLSVDIGFDILNHFLTNPYEAITVVDADAILRYVSPVHERFFGFHGGDALGRPVQEVIENTKLHEVARSGTAQIGQVQEMKNVTRVVNRVPILRNDKLVGAIGRVMFKAPAEVHELSRHISSLRAEVDYYKNELAGLRQRTMGLDAIVGESDCIRRLKAEILKIAPLDVPVFITGESGTGKELVAHAIHNVSRREDHPMVVVNCGALPETLVESELFGYEGGAFTGARREGRIGKFEMADGSSLFLDEIGDMPMEVQVKLLRVVESGVFERLGSNKQRTTKFRLISATNRDMQQRISREEFRADLYFRIDGVTLQIPPLRQRREDIPLLVFHFLRSITQKIGTNLSGIERRAVEMLQEHAWPGNVRQLYHEVQRAIIFADGPELKLSDFKHLYGEDTVKPTGVQTPSPQSPMTIRQSIGSMEAVLIQEAMQLHRGNKKRVAQELGISRTYLYKKLAELEQD